MRRFSVLLVVLLLIVSTPWPGSSAIVSGRMASAAQSDGHTYTSPTFGYRLSWDASWFVSEESSDEGIDYLLLSNGLTTLELTGVEAFAGNASICINSIRGWVLTTPDFSDVQPLTDGSGEPIGGEEPGRVWSVLRFLATMPDGTAIELAAYLECRALVPGEAVVTVIATMPLVVYGEQVAVVEQITNSLEIPSPGEQGPAFMAGSWRIAVVSGAQVRSLGRLGIDPLPDYEWIVYIADVTNWDQNDATFPVADLRLQLDSPSLEPLRPHGSTTERAARRLEVAPGDYKLGVPIAVDETVRVAIVFKVNQGVRATGLSLGDSSLNLTWLPHALTATNELPPVLSPPSLTEVRVLDVISGDRLEVEMPDGSTAMVSLIYVDPPVEGECYTKEATRRLQRLVGRSDGTVWLETEPTSNGALYWAQASKEPSVYVWLKDPKGRWVLGNHDLVVHGFAQQRASRTQSRFGGWLAAAEGQARAEETGLWGACTGHNGDPAPSTAESSPVSASSAGRGAISAKARSLKNWHESQRIG